MKIGVTAIIILIVVSGLLFYRSSNQFDIPEGNTVSLEKPSIEVKTENSTSTEKNITITMTHNTGSSNREVFITGGVKHSIPLAEIISGGPPKDGIPSIDKPEFISTKDADSFLDAGDVGLGLVINGEARFYPYQILVFHELVNDNFGEVPVLVSYCPLCATGVVFNRRLPDGTAQEFGVSGKLWQSNLLMYNRTGNPETESLWSQVLGEAVLGPQTGSRLDIISSDTVRYSDWKQKHPETAVLSKETGFTRPYGTDPYGSNTPIIGATFDDDRLGAKDFVLGVEVNGKFKAYHNNALAEGTTEDTFAGENITIEKDGDGSVIMFVGKNREELPYIGGFWFSWVAAHPDTSL